MHIRYLFAPFVAVVVGLWAAPVFAFDYLEHLWFTDDGCRRAQEVLASELARSPELTPAFLALALACPVSWDKPYCAEGRKLARGHLNLLHSKRAHGYSATLGDFSALGDHVSRQGPIKNLPRARGRGLVSEMLQWLVTKPRGVSGPIGHVADDACRTGGLEDFAQVGNDIDDRLGAWADGQISSVPYGQLPAVMRDPVPRGPHDRPMQYSFDNPHYLDLVLRNHHHFGEAAHDAWNGFHGAATRMMTRTCADLLVVDADEAEDLADDVPGYGGVDWDEIPGDQLAGRVCAMLGDVVRSRLAAWTLLAPQHLVASVKVALSGLEADPMLTDQVVVRLLSLIFEGTGLHYLQDGLAGGHMRTIRSREALVEVRHDHDADNRDGVAAVIETPVGAATFVAWGDGYLLGRAPATHCDWSSNDPPVISTCLLRQHRGVVAAATIASLVDWAHGGAVYRGLDCSAGVENTICRGLPVAAPRVAGPPPAQMRTTLLVPGNMPVPPPDFSFESLSVGFGLAPWTSTPLLSARFATFGEMDIPAHWLRSWQIRLETGLGTGANQTLGAEVGFGFHYRIYARVMLDLVPVVFAGVRDFSGSGMQAYAGLAPRIGLSMLPEGWVKIPIEFTLFLDQQIVFLATDSPFLSEVGDSRPRGTVGFGLAYMH